MSHRLRSTFIASLFLTVAFPVVAAGANESESASLPKLRGRAPVIADPQMKELDRRLRAGRATGPEHRAYYEFLVDHYPYDRMPDPDVRTRAVASHRKNLASRAAAKASGKLGALGAGEWLSIGPNNVPGRMTAIAVHPTTPNVIYVGAAAGGVWKTSDSGATWTSLSDFEGTLSVGALILDPVDPNTIYVGTGEGNFSSDRLPGAGLMKSSDAGASWTLHPIDAPYRKGIRRLDLDPTDRRTLFAAADNGLIRSTDAGATWSLVSGLPSASWDFATDIVRLPATPETLFVAFADLYGRNDPSETTPGIWRSTDRGTTWTELAGGLPTANVGRIALAVAASEAQTLYAGIHRTTDDKLLGFYVSTDAGTTWTQKVATPNYCSQQCWYDNVLAVDPTDARVVYAGGLDVYRTLDGGESWAKLSNWATFDGDPKFVHADQHHFATPTAGEVYVACDGGLFHSTNKGLAWTNLGKGLVTTQSYSLTGAEAETQPLLSGLQDNGTIKYGGTTDWSTVYGGDGGFTAVDPASPNNMMTEYVYADVVRSLNGGRTWQNGSAGIGANDRPLFIAPFVMDPGNSQRLLLGTNKVYLTTSFGAGWSAISPDLTTTGTSGSVSAVAFDPTDPLSGWAGTTDGNLQVTRNLGAGATWTNLARAPLPGRAVRAIAVDPTDGKRIFVTYSGFDTTTPATPGHVFRTLDGGASWANVSAGLPDQPVRSVIIDPDATQVVYLGTDLGVYASSDGGESWLPFGEKFPFTSVHMLMLNRTLRRLRAGTHGRGVWELDVPVPSQVRSIVVPVATHRAGANGTFYVTDARIVNPSTSTADATLLFTPSGQDASAAISRSVQVVPGGTLRLDDVVLGTFGLADAFGKLEVRSASKVVVSARTYNNGATGTFGQFEPGATSADAVVSGGAALHLPGLERSTDFRTNVGLVEIGGLAAVVQVRMLDDAGRVVGIKTFPLPAGGSLQVNDVFGAAGVAGETTRARAEVTVLSGGAVVAYASVVDNRSGDAIFVPARLRPVDNNSLVLPVAAKNAGANASFWRTDLTLFNTNPTEPRTVSLAFLPAGADGSVAPRQSITLTAGESRTLADVVGNTFSTSGAGAVWIETSPIGQGDVIASGRIYTVDGAGASYGQFVRARSASEASGPGVVQTLAGAVATTDFRTNGGFVNASGTATTVSATLVDAAGGVAGTGSFVVAPYSLTLVGGIVAALRGNANPLTEGRIDFQGSAGSVLGYISIVDNRTNDPTLVPSILRP